MELYIGIDVSKTKLDMYINDIENKEYEFPNSEVGLKNLVELLKNLQT